MGGLPICAARTVMSFRHTIAGSTLDERVGFIKPPQLSDNAKKDDESITLDWRWLMLKCERRLTARMKKIHSSSRAPIDKNKKLDVSKYACFVPRTVLEAIADKRIRFSDEFDINIENFNGAVVFCDASGFTALTGALEKEPNGAEKLGDCINQFFKPLIEIVNAWGGDIIKFSGDAITIVWPVDDVSGFTRRESNEQAIPDGLYHIDQLRACYLACQCCKTLHERLDHFPTPIKDTFFMLHNCVAYGKVAILQVGGTLDRWEYVVAGLPLKEIAVGEPLANKGETVVAPSVYAVLKDQMDMVDLWQGFNLEVAGIDLDIIDMEDGSTYARLRHSTKKLEPPPPLENIKLDVEDIELMKRLTAGYDDFIDEIRPMTVIFIGIKGLDVETESGSLLAHQVMQLIQKAAYTMEGNVNKFLVDDKGVLVLLMFGLRPVYHIDDALRAVLAAMRISDGLGALNLNGGIGIATGRVWTGLVGCAIRKEYTALGDSVNIAARLMSSAANNAIHCSLKTKQLSEHAIEYLTLPPIKLKGKSGSFQIFRPTGKLIGGTESFYTSEKEALKDWNEWKPKQRIEELFCPQYVYRDVIINVDVPLLDYPTEAGPLYPWEIFEPWMPSLLPWIHLGGVALITGKENEGSKDIVQIIAEMAKSRVKSIFVCSNMPELAYINIGEAPLLAWRKLCTNMLAEWCFSSARELKGYAKVDQDNSFYGLAKELLHPMYHWCLPKMKPVIENLLTPYELMENRAYIEHMSNFEDHKPKSRFSHIKGHNFFRKSVGLPSLRNKSILGRAHTDSKMFSAEKDNWDDHENKFLASHLRSTFPSAGDRSLAPMISSLIQGYTMYESTLVCLHVKKGTSLFGLMDSESWKVARFVARIAMLRRRQKLENDMKALKKWRRHHSRTCAQCLLRPLIHHNPLNYSVSRQVRTATSCVPPQSKCFPPFYFVVVCEEMMNTNQDQNKILAYARECNALMELQRLHPEEVISYIAFCLNVKAPLLPHELVVYIARTTARIPVYIRLTTQHLLNEGVIARVDRVSMQEEVTVTTEFLTIARESTFACSSKKAQETATKGFMPDEVTVYRFSQMPLENSTAEKSDDALNKYAVSVDEAVQVWPKEDFEEVKAYYFKSTAKESPKDEISGEDSAGRLLGVNPLQLISENQALSVTEEPILLPKVTYPKFFLEPLKSSLNRPFSIDANINLADSTPPQMACIQGKIEIRKPLKNVSFVAELNAAAMSLLEHLEPEEQFVAKSACVFQVPFALTELQVVCSRKVTSQRLAIIIENLVEKELLEVYDESADRIFGCIVQTPDNEFERLTRYQYCSTAYQTVVLNLLLSHEKAMLSQLATEAINLRRLYTESELAILLDKFFAEPHGSLVQDWLRSISKKASSHKFAAT